MRLINIISLILICNINIILANTPKDGTRANSILTNSIWLKADNAASVSNSKVTNVVTNCGGQFMKVTPDITNGFSGGTFYFTNRLKNWGNATDTFILRTTDTNSSAGASLPWTVWFANLSLTRITNIKIGPGLTNTFFFVVRPSIAAQVGSWAEYRIAAKSTNSTFGNNTTIYTGDNAYNYGGPDNGGLGRGSDGVNYINVYSNSTPQVVNGEYLRVTLIGVSNYYVDDNSDVNDVWTLTAIGNDSNDGLTVSTPKATLTNLLSTYNLKPGDKVYIDTGTYKHPVKVTPNHYGNTSKYLTFLGTGTNNTIFNVTNLSVGFRITNSGYIKLSSFNITKANNQNLYLDVATNCIITNLKIDSSKGDGIFLWSSDRNRIEKVKVIGCTNYGINLNFSCDKIMIRGCDVSYNNTAIQSRLSSSNTMVSNKITRNRLHGFYTEMANFIFYTNNNVSWNKGDGFSLPARDYQYIYGNISYSNRRSGISLYTQSGDWCDNNYIMKNYLVKNSNEGIYIQGSKNIMWSNIIATNGKDGLKAFGATNFIIGNQSYSNHAQGVWLEGARGVIVSNNDCYFNYNNGIATANRSGAKIINNRLYRNREAGISFYYVGGGCNDCLVKKNVMYKNGTQGMYCNGRRNLIISNVSYSNTTHGFEIDGDNSSVTNLFNLSYRNQSSGLVLNNISGGVVRNNTLFRNGQNGIKRTGVLIGSVRNCIAVSNSRIGYTNLANLLTYSLAYGNTVFDYSATPGTGCLTNDVYFTTTDPSSPDFLHLSTNVPSPAINAGDPTDPVPSGGGTRIDMGCYEAIIGTALLGLNKYVEDVTLAGISRSAIPGATIYYRIHFTNEQGIGENCIIYDRIMTNHTTYVSNSYTNSQSSWSVEFASNDNPSQTWNSTDYTSTQFEKNKIQWIRWKRSVIGTANSGDLYFKVTIK